MTLDAQCAERDHIFISYRRDDARGTSGRLYDWLRIGFGRERVFRDVQSVGVGKWRNKIDAALARSSVCVVVIGPRWANADNLPRLHDESDMVRHEIVTALASEQLTLVPTLVEGAEVPKAAVLPRALQPLFAVWNARRVTEDGWEDDTRRLITEIADASRLQVDPNLHRWLSDAGAAQHRVAEREQGLQSGEFSVPLLPNTRVEALFACGAWSELFARVDGANELMALPMRTVLRVRNPSSLTRLRKEWTGVPCGVRWVWGHERIRII